MTRAKKKQRRSNRPDAAPDDGSTVVSRSAFARRAGRTKSAITHACERGGPLAGAVRGSGIDESHPAALAYLTGGTAPEQRAELASALQRKRVAEAARAEMLVARAQGELVSRRLVEQHLIGVLDGAFRRLLMDVPAAGAQQLYAMCRSGASLEAAELALREIQSGTLRGIKERMARALADGE